MDIIKKTSINIRKISINQLNVSEVLSFFSFTVAVYIFKPNIKISKFSSFIEKYDFIDKKKFK